MACYHTRPAHNDQGDREIIRYPGIKNVEYVTQTYWEEAERRNEQAPEIPSSVELERRQTENDQFNCIVPGDGDKH